MLLIHMNLFFLCTFVVFLSGQFCNSNTTQRSLEQICCNRYVLGDIRCVACQIGLYQHVNGNCEPCPETGGYRCRRKLERRIQQFLDINIQEDIYMYKMMYLYVLAVIFGCLLIISCVCMWCKFELSCKMRCQDTDQTTTTHPNESGNNPPPGETHQYDEVDDGFLNHQSSVNDGHDVRSSGSSSGGSGICGIDSDGYLNPYHALNSIEITIGQGASSEQSSTETSYVQAQENSVYFQISE